MEDDTPLQRLKSAFGYALQRVEPGEEVPEIPPQLREWTQNTAVAMMAGILYGGGREYLAIRRLGTYRPQEEGLSKAQIARAIAEENTQRMLRFSRKAIRGCFQFGSLAGLFYAVQKLQAVAYAEASLSDTVVAAALTGGVAGAFMPGSPSLRARSSLLGIILGGLIGYPTAFLQQQVDERLQELRPDLVAVKKQPPPSRYPLLEGNPADEVIHQLETAGSQDQRNL